MKTHRTASFPLIVIAAMGLATGGCSLFHPHPKQPKSGYKIIEEGDPNPYIHETPYIERDSPTEKVEVERGPVGSQ